MKKYIIVFCALMLASQAAAQTQAVGFGGGFDRTAPVDVSADNLKIDQASGRAILSGKVLISQDNLKLTAETVEVDYIETEGKRTIRRLIAEGNVLIVSGSDAAEGQHAVYTLGDAEIAMTGAVLLTQGENTLAGERLLVNLETGAGTVSGRVRTTFSAGEN